MKPQPTMRLRETKETEDDRHFKCPAEVYGTDVTAAVLPRLYVSREECARNHGCSRSTCEIAGHWPRPGEPAGEEMDPSIAGFIMHGFNGPVDPTREPMESPDAPGEDHRGKSCGPGCLIAPWEFLVSD
jgi:hypothetical protein